ncbi:MAG: molecular chaperone DnaJ [Cyanobacteria bacterium P01_F01_bin.42]
MTGDLVQSTSETARQLDEKKQALTALEFKLAQRELDLATAQAELDTFEHHYMQVVGMRQQELERIEAQVVEYAASLETDQGFSPSLTLKQLYRDIAKQIHPDLATDPDERRRRESLMAEVNRAYAAGDAERLRQLFRDWQDSPDSIQGDDAEAELQRTIRKIAQSQNRLQSIESQISALEETDLFVLMQKQQRIEKLGRNLLTEMASQLEKQIQSAQKRLQTLKDQIY